MRLSLLVFSILFECDRAVFGDDELRAILKGFEFAGDAPETGFQFFLRFENLAPDLERNAAGGVAGGGVTEKAALLCAPLSHRGDKNDEPQILAVGNFGDGDVAAQSFINVLLGACRTYLNLFTSDLIRPLSINAIIL